MESYFGFDGMGLAVYTVAVPAERRIYMEMGSGNGDSADP